MAAVHAEVGDGGLPLVRDQPVDEGLALAGVMLLCALPVVASAGSEPAREVLWQTNAWGDDIHLI